MSDIHALSGPYAVHALDDIERAQFERHIRGCDTCQAEVDSLREAAALLAETTVAEPSPELRARLLSQIQTVRPLPPVVVSPSNVVSLRRRRLTRGLAAAAAAAVLAGTGGVVWHASVDSSHSTEVAPTISNVLHASDAKKYVGDRATLVRSKSLHAAVLISNDMAALPSDKTYEAWLKLGDSYVPAGLISSGTHEFLLQGDAKAAVEAAVTIEPTGGSATPTLPATVQFPFEQA